MSGTREKRPIPLAAAPVPTATSHRSFSSPATRFIGSSLHTLKQPNVLCVVRGPKHASPANTVTIIAGYTLDIDLEEQEHKNNYFEGIREPKQSTGFWETV